MFIVNGQKINKFVINGESVKGISSNGITTFKSTPKKYALISTGTQYIDTEIKPESTGIAFPFEIDHKVLYYVDTQSGSGRSGNCRMGAVRGTGGPTYGYIFATVNGPTIPLNQWTVIKVAGKKNAVSNYSNLEISMVVNGITNSVIGTTSDQPTWNIWLFALNNNGTPQYTGSQKMEYYKITYKGNLVRDFVAVPLGNTDYSTTPAPSNCLWDKISQQYFVNKGTGSFGIEEIF